MIPEKTINQIRAKLSAENARDLSDAEIERVFKNCVRPELMIKIAKELRDKGILQSQLKLF